MVAAGLIAAGFGPGLLIGLLIRDRRRQLVAENNHWLGEDIEALKGADLFADVHRDRQDNVVDLSGSGLPARSQATVVVAEVLAKRLKGRWKIAGPMSAVPLAREAVGALLMLPQGRRLCREVLAHPVPFHDQDAPKASEVRL